MRLERMMSCKELVDDEGEVPTCVSSCVQVWTGQFYYYALSRHPVGY